MVCDNCGASAPVGSAFCPACGTAFSAAPDRHPAALAPLKVTGKKGFRRAAAVPEAMAGKPSPKAPVAPGPAKEPVKRAAKEPAKSPAKRQPKPPAAAATASGDVAVAAPAAPSSLPPIAVARQGFKLPKWLVPALAAVVLIGMAATAGYFFLMPKVAAASGPEGAAQRMFEAFAAYDGKAILDNATHSSMTETDTAAFEKQVADAKAIASGKPNLKGLKIESTEYPDPKDKNTAVIKASAQWLVDPVKGTYEQRTETVTVIFKDGKWQVRLFQ